MIILLVSPQGGLYRHLPKQPSVVRCLVFQHRREIQTVAQVPYSFISYGFYPDAKDVIFS